MEDLSKSSILYGMQCEKRLYWHVHEPHSEPLPDAAHLALLEEGKIVEDAARGQFQKGVLISVSSHDAQAALGATQDALARGETTLFQPAFICEGVFVRLDILDRLPSGQWRLIEVKAGTRVQRKHLPDVAIQYWVAQGAGLDIERCEVMHLNKDCRHPHLDELFLFTDVTPRLVDTLKQIPTLLNRFRQVLGFDEEPRRDIGRHCRHPTACGHEKRCREKFKIPAISVFNIPKLETRLKWNLFEQGQVHLSTLSSIALTPLQRRMVDCTLTGKRFVNAESIARIMASWKAPFYYLDFETISAIIPAHPGLHPGGSLPFQFSVRESTDGMLREHAYLHPDRSDPRPALISALLGAIGTEGSIVTYNKGTEKNVLLALADLSRGTQSERLRHIATRLVDVLPIMRAHVYDPAFGGSFSLKDVAPALFGDRFAYDGLSVADGLAAQRAFLRLSQGGLSDDDRLALRSEMLLYCGRDTEALAQLTQWLLDQRP